MMTTAQKTAPSPVYLNPDLKSPAAQEFEDKLTALIVGQDRAVRRITGLYQIFLAGLAHPGRPIGTLLFLGPTGSGKTRVVEAASEVLFGDTNLVTKIDCAEFQHSHEIAKLIGSPPGYLGHRETSPMLTQENLDRSHTETTKLSLVLFDEIEKASDALWQLLLGILDKATLTLGDNRRVDLSRCIIVMTSNLGTAEMKKFLLHEGTDAKYGARHLKRAIEKNIVFPLANLVATRQVKLGDFVRIDMSSDGRLAFVKEAEGALVPVLLEKYSQESGAVAATARAGRSASRREFSATSLLNHSK